MLTDEKKSIEERKNRILKNKSEKLKSQLVEKKTSKPAGLEISDLYAVLKKIEGSINGIKENYEQPVYSGSLRALREEFYAMRDEFEARLEQLENKLGAENVETKTNTVTKEKEEVKKDYSISTVIEESKAPIEEPTIDPNSEGYNKVTAREQASDLLLSSAINIIKDIPQQSASAAINTESTQPTQTTADEPTFQATETQTAPQESKFENVVAPEVAPTVKYVDENIKAFKIVVSKAKNTFFTFVSNSAGSIKSMPNNVKESFDNNLKSKTDETTKTK